MSATLRVTICLAITSLLTGTVVAQTPGADSVQMRTTRLAPDLHVIEGIGGPVIGATLALSGPDGVLMVDAQLAEVHDKLLAALRKISDKPVRYLVNTHAHGDHVGGNANFAREGALLFSRDQLRARLAQPPAAADGKPGKPTPPEALPVVTYDGVVTLHLNGEQVQLIPIRAAHTGGDTLVRFVDHDVLATGDYFRTEGYPRVDRRGGGSLAGILAGLGETIGLAGPKTRVVPGHGPITDRNGLIAQRDLLLSVRDLVRPLVAQGKTVEEIVAARPTAAFDPKVVLMPGETPDQFVRWLVAELQSGT